MIKIIGIALAGSITCVLIKKYSPEYFILCELGVGVMLMLTIYPYLCDYLDFFSEYNTSVGLEDENVFIVIKAMGVALITNFGVDICKDNGENSLAGNLELCGKLTMLVLVIPMMKAIIELAVKLINTK